jgi:hypothetical protein
VYLPQNGANNTNREESLPSGNRIRDLRDRYYRVLSQANVSTEPTLPNAPNSEERI